MPHCDKILSVQIHRMFIPKTLQNIEKEKCIVILVIYFWLKFLIHVKFPTLCETWYVKFPAPGSGLESNSQGLSDRYIIIQSKINEYLPS